MAFTLHTAVTLVEPWARLYRDHGNVSAGVAFLHLGGLLAAGGFAIAADRGTLRAFAGDPAARRSHVAELGAVHRPVLLGLMVVMASGILMLAADLETLLLSPVFWAKMALVAALLANGLGLTRAGRRLETDPDSETGWMRLRRWSLSSLALWFAVTLAGTLLTNAG
jgi:hypothetical protein